MTALNGVSPPDPVPVNRSTSPDALLMAKQHLRGRHAGFATRFIAFLFDCVVSIGVFMLALAAASFAASVLTGQSIHWSRQNLWVVIAFFAWEFFYYAYSWTASGRTPACGCSACKSSAGTAAARAPGAGSCEHLRSR